MSLWTAFEIAEAVDGEVQGAFCANGVTFDSREVGPGDLFIALNGEATDGHRFIASAFDNGAAGAIVSESIEQPHVRVADTMAALNALGRAARAFQLHERLSRVARRGVARGDEDDHVHRGGGQSWM